MWRLHVSSEAELEIFEAALRYERERAGLGFRFEAQVNTVFARLLENPFQFPATQEGDRRALTAISLVKTDRCSGGVQHVNYVGGGAR